MEVKGSKSNSFIRNKYIEYRRRYINAQKFSKKMDSSDTKSKAKAKADGTKKLDPSPKSAENNPTQQLGAKQTPQTSTTQTQIGILPARTTNTLADTQYTAQITPQLARHSDRMKRKLEQYRPQIKAAAARYNLPEELIAGVIWQESRANPRAVSHCGAMGLMQLMPGTAKQLGVRNAFSPSQNIDGGAKYLRQMIDKFGRVDFAVAAYNAGPGNVQKHGGIPPFRETRDYVPKVLGYANGFKVAGGFPEDKPATAFRV